MSNDNRKRPRSLGEVASEQGVDLDSAAFAEFFKKKEEEFRKEYAQMSKPARWAALLDCKPGEKPWIIKDGLFTSADRRAEKLIAKIKNIHDQELLACIAKGTNRVDVCCAAIKNLTDQNALKQLADCKNSKVRAAAAKKITDTKELKRLAIYDTDASVRAAAVKKITDTKELKRLAIYDTDASVRKVAAKCLPEGTVEKPLLIQAAELSQEIEPYRLEAFEHKIQIIKDADPLLFKELAEHYPNSTVNYLLWEQNAAKSNTEGSVENRLRRQTPPTEIVHCRNMLRDARSWVDSFLRNCDAASKSGRRTYQESREFSSNTDDVRCFASLLSCELGFKGFSQAKVSYEAQYSTVYDYNNNKWVNEKKILYHNVVVSASW